MRKKFLPLLLLIVCNIVLVLGTLFVTRHSLYDLEHTVYAQRNHYKTVSMLRMANYYYHSQENVSGEALGKFLANTITEPSEAHFLAHFEPDSGYPWIWIGGNQRFHKYLQYGNIAQSIVALDSLGTVAYSESYAVIQKFSSYSATNDREPVVITARDGAKYLVTWVIIPEPTPAGAKFLYVVLTPTETLTFSIEGAREKYTWLFSAAATVAGMMLILIPITVKRFII